jgi:mevalonate kinase
MTQATAPGKIILFGEHAVVYGRPAIAAPVTQVQATAVVEPGNQPGVYLIAPDLGLDYLLAEAAEADPLATAVRLAQTAANLPELPPLTITVSSTIPIASGLGSGAAIGAALIRALALHWQRPDLATNEQVSALTYQVERLLHGTPSGIDNTVVAFNRPVYFRRRQPHNQIETLAVAQPIRLLVADTGVRSSTKVAVDDVRRQWQAEPARLEALFTGCGRIAQAARPAIEEGDLVQLGRLMNENHDLLQQMTVSSTELDLLVAAARQAGALGAKLSGAGRGGNMIALVNATGEEAVRTALYQAAAAGVISTVIETNNLR